MYYLSIANCKGGVGKSTTAINLCDNLMKRGYKVLLVDTDPQRNSSDAYHAKTVGVNTVDTLLTKKCSAEECIQTTAFGDIIAGDENLIDADQRIPSGPTRYMILTKALRSIEDRYDFCIFDTPPAMNTLLGNALFASQGIICPVECSRFGLQGLKDFFGYVEQFQEVNKDLRVLGLLRVKYKGRQKLTADIENNILPKLADMANTKIFHNAIKESVKVVEAQAKQVRLSKYAPYCTPAINYEMLTDELLADLNYEIKKGN